MRKIKEDNQRSAFFDEADIAFVLLDKNLNVVDANESLLKSMRMSISDLVGRNILEISPDAQSNGRLDLYREVLRTGVAVEMDDVKPHASFGNYHTRIRAFKVGEGLGIVSKNITDLKETIEELETFIYKSSHDMRGPVASILGLVHLADTSLKSKEEAKIFFKEIKQQTERLDHILQTLIGTTSMRKGEKTIHLINFREIVDSILKSMKYIPGFEIMQVETTVILDSKFYSDKSLLISIFQNLLDNAFKYRRMSIENPSVKINIISENEGVKIKVADNGIGIPHHLHQDIFKMFFRGTEQASGSGLGLYTVDHTVKRLGGSISLESNINLGTTFSIYIPSEKTEDRPA